MKIMKTNYQNYKPRFGFKIEAPDEFKYTIKNPNRSQDMVAEFNKSLKLLKRIQPNKTLILSMSKELDGWDADFIYKAMIKEDNYKLITKQKNRGWVELIIQTAKNLSRKK